MKNIVVSIIILILGLVSARAGILNIRPKHSNKFGFHKKVNWDNFGRQLTTFSGILFIVLGLISIFFSVSQYM